MPLFQKATFLTTVAHLRDLPVDAVCEVAFAGRSNAGKSSAINTLANHVRLAYVSKTPGRTQHLNYFTLETGKYLVDLPGYGYAKAPEAVRSQWEGLIGPYLQGRAPLVGLVMIMDARHPLTDLDWGMIDWFLPTGRPIHVLLSKADKLNRQASIETLRKVRSALQAKGDHLTVQLFSSLKKSGIEEAETLLAGWLGMELVKAPKPQPKPKAAKGVKKIGKDGKKIREPKRHELRALAEARAAAAAGVEGAAGEANSPSATAAPAVPEAETKRPPE